MRNLLFLLVFLLAAGTLYPATGWVFTPADDTTIRVGADFRARFESYTRDILNLDGGMSGPDVQYFRFRTRLWTGIELGEDFTLNLRLTNRSQYYTSNIADPNNNGAATWRFPDEIILDEANVVFRNLFGYEQLSLTAGRQNFRFGNGLIIWEGTPFDQGRSTYFDALRVRWQDERNDLSVLLMYNTWKDRWGKFDDQNRRLRSGDILTAGFYWEHDFCPGIKTDLYYFFDDVNDNHENQAERFFPADMNLSMHTAGLRISGKPLDFLEYSLEGAMQTGRNSRGRPIEARLFDGRLDFHLPADWLKCHSTLGMAYTHFSGDKTGTGSTEGWMPLWSATALWDENFFPVGWNACWSNLDMYQGTFTLRPTDNLSLRLRVAGCFAPRVEQRTGSGNFYGLLTSLFAAWKANEHLALSAELSHMSSGNYYAAGENANWLQLQATWTF